MSVWLFQTDSCSGSSQRVSPDVQEKDVSRSNQTAFYPTGGGQPCGSRFIVR